MPIKPSKLPVFICIWLFLSYSTRSSDCSEFISLLPDYECQDMTDSPISGLSESTFIVNKKDSQTKLLMLVLSDPEMIQSYKYNLEKTRLSEITLKLNSEVQNDQIFIQVFEIPENLNVFTQLLEQNYFTQDRQILLLGKRLLDALMANAPYIAMGDINANNIFLDKDYSPKLLLLTSKIGHESSVRELSFALGVLLYTLSQKNEPFKDGLQMLSPEVENTPLKFAKGTPLDLVTLITTCLSQSPSTDSFDSLHDTFLRIVKRRTLGSLEQDLEYVPSGKEVVQSTVESKTISMAIVFIYAAIFLVGSIVFCVMKKPLEAQQREQVNPMMHGLDNAERNLHMFQQNQGMEPPQMRAPAI